MAACSGSGRSSESTARAHVQQPGVPLGRADPERRVPHPQPRVAALRGVGVRAAPVLHQEQRQPLGGRAEVLLRVHRPQQRVRRPRRRRTRRPACGTSARRRPPRRSSASLGLCGHRSILPGAHRPARRTVRSAGVRRRGGSRRRCGAALGWAAALAWRALGRRSAAACRGGRRLGASSARRSRRRRRGARPAQRPAAASAPRRPTLHSPTTSGIARSCRPAAPVSSTAPPWHDLQPLCITPNARARYPCGRACTNRPLAVGIRPADGEAGDSGQQRDHRRRRVEQRRAPATSGASTANGRISAVPASAGRPAGRSTRPPRTKPTGLAAMIRPWSSRGVGSASPSVGGPGRGQALRHDREAAITANTISAIERSTGVPKTSRKPSAVSPQQVAALRPRSMAGGRCRTPSADQQRRDAEGQRVDAAAPAGG